MGHDSQHSLRRGWDPGAHVPREEHLGQPIRANPSGKAPRPSEVLGVGDLEKAGEEEADGAWLQAQDQLKQQGPPSIPLAFLSHVRPEIVPNQNLEDLKAMD